MIAFQNITNMKYIAFQFINAQNKNTAFCLYLKSSELWMEEHREKLVRISLEENS